MSNTPPIPVDPASAFDVRIVEHQARIQKLDSAAYEAWLAELPDDAEHGQESGVRFSTPHADRVTRRR
jgi:hypothetical protein